MAAALLTRGESVLPRRRRELSLVLVLALAASRAKPALPAPAALPPAQQPPRTEERPERPASRRRWRLLFNHIPKCGGTEIKTALKSGLVVPPWNARIVKEFHSSTAKHARDHFVIASLRDPCRYYVSLFGYAASSLGRFRHVARAVLPAGTPVDVAVRNATAFGRFLEAVAGCLTLRVFASLPDMAVDCWVRTDALFEDMRLCLRAYGAQGGTLLPGWEGALRNATAREAGGDSAAARNANASPHAPCDYYYATKPEHRALVERQDAGVCALLGGCRCCGQLRPGVLGEGVDPHALRPSVPLRFAMPGPAKDACFKEPLPELPGDGLFQDLFQEQASELAEQAGAVRDGRTAGEQPAGAAAAEGGLAGAAAEIGAALLRGERPQPGKGTGSLIRPSKSKWRINGLFKQLAGARQRHVGG